MVQGTPAKSIQRAERGDLQAIAQKRIQGWQVTVIGLVGAYLAVGAATGTVRPYHWVMLAVVPVVLLARDSARGFLLDWAPIIAFWLIYDRLRLVQRLLLARVAVVWPFDLEQALFGWLGNGDVPAHYWRRWLAGHIASPLWSGISVGAQLVYFSHLFIFPGLLLALWLRGRTREIDRNRFLVHVRAFTLLHAIGILTYILLPVAPPWWVSLHGLTMPTPELFANTDIHAAMDGAIIQRLIGNASQWFAAVPSLHGAYPVLLVLLQLRNGSKQLALAFAIYGLAMFAATVALNQHYIIDLLAGAVAALLAFRCEELLRKRETLSDWQPRPIQ
jgi:hypothetical protein